MAEERVRPKRLPPLSRPSVARSFRNLLAPGSGTLGQKLDNLFAPPTRPRYRRVHVAAKSASVHDDSEVTPPDSPQHRRTSLRDEGDDAAKTSGRASARHMSRMLSFMSDVTFRPRMLSNASSRVASAMSDATFRPHLLSASSRIASFLSRRFDMLNAPSFLSIRHERRHQVDLAQTDDHNFWAMNVPALGRSTYRFEPATDAAPPTDLPPRVKGEPFCTSLLQYDDVKVGRGYYIMYKYRSVMNDRVSLAFQAGTCKLAFNYGRTGWIFMFTDVTNVYDVMTQEDDAWLRPVVIFDTRAPSVCEELSFHDLGLVMAGHPAALGALRRFMWRTSGQHQYADLKHMQRCFHLNVFSRPA